MPAAPSSALASPAMPSPAIPSPAIASPAPAVPAPLATLITDLLHEMGQPLTTLQGCQLLPLLAVDDRDALAAEMAGQVERITTLYRALRQLLAAIMPANPAPPSPTDLPQTLHTAAREWQRQAERQHVTLQLDLPPHANFAQAVSLWTQHAVESVIAAALPPRTDRQPASREPCRVFSRRHHHPRCLPQSTPTSTATRRPALTRQPRPPRGTRPARGRGRPRGIQPATIPCHHLSPRHGNPPPALIRSPRPCWIARPPQRPLRRIVLNL